VHNSWLTITARTHATHVQKYVPELVWPTPFQNNPGITWRTLAGQIRYVADEGVCARV
jgi:hypothetical protein